jgi:hypothetical protein
MPAIHADSPTTALLPLNAERRSSVAA